MAEPQPLQREMNFTGMTDTVVAEREVTKLEALSSKCEVLRNRMEQYRRALLDTTNSVLGERPSTVSDRAEAAMESDGVFYRLAYEVEMLEAALDSLGGEIVRYTESNL